MAHVVFRNLGFPGEYLDSEGNLCRSRTGEQVYLFQLQNLHISMVLLMEEILHHKGMYKTLEIMG